MESSSGKDSIKKSKENEEKEESKITLNKDNKK